LELRTTREEKHRLVMKIQKQSQKNASLIPAQQAKRKKARRQKNQRRSKKNKNLIGLINS